jgi:hypothetical protein
MARGWDSKSVEDQIDAANAEKSQKSRPRITADEREQMARRSGLLLARAKTLKDLEAAHDPRYRGMLERALADLDAQLAQTDTS